MNDAFSVRAHWDASGEKGDHGPSFNSSLAGPAPISSSFRTRGDRGETKHGRPGDRDLFVLPLGDSRQLAKCT
jgi:hypothetical protein